MMEASLDYFGGVLVGNFPFFSPEVYKANVFDFKIQGSMNFTFNFKIQFGQMLKLNYEINMVPLLLGLEFNAYSTSSIGDNCGWITGDINTFLLSTSLTKNIAQCGNNFIKKLI